MERKFRQEKKPGTGNGIGREWWFLVLRSEGTDRAVPSPGILKGHLLLAFLHSLFIIDPNGLQFFRGPADLLGLDGLEVL